VLGALGGVAAALDALSDGAGAAADGGGMAAEDDAGVVVGRSQARAVRLKMSPVTQRIIVSFSCE
jgi:hypothetical protein